MDLRGVLPTQWYVFHIGVMFCFSNLFCWWRRRCCCCCCNWWYYCKFSMFWWFRQIFLFLCLQTGSEKIFTHSTNPITQKQKLYEFYYKWNLGRAISSFLFIPLLSFLFTFSHIASLMVRLFALPSIQDIVSPLWLYR